MVLLNSFNSLRLYRDPKTAESEVERTLLISFVHLLCKIESYLGFFLTDYPYIMTTGVIEYSLYLLQCNCYWKLYLSLEPDNYVKINSAGSNYLMIHTCFNLIYKY